MKLIILLLVAVVTAAGIVASIALTSGHADGEAVRSAREVRGASPYGAIENEPPPKLVVDPPLAEPMKMGAIQIQCRVENVHIVPVFGTGAQRISAARASTSNLRRPAVALGGCE